MELNKQAEVSLHGQAADIEFTIERKCDNVWEFHIKDTLKGTVKSLVLNNEQTSATLASFIVLPFLK